MTQSGVESSPTQSHVFLLFCWHGQKAKKKKRISAGREKETVKDERECQSAKINRWIKTTADVSLFTIPLLCIHLLLSLSTLSSSDAARKAKKCWQTVVWAILSIFICTRSKKKIKKYISVTSSSPTPPLKHFVSPTLLQSSAPQLIKPLLVADPESRNSLAQALFP